MAEKKLPPPHYYPIPTHYPIFYAPHFQHPQGQPAVPSAACTGMRRFPPPVTGLHMHPAEPCTPPPVTFPMYMHPESQDFQYNLQAMPESYQKLMWHAYTGIPQGTMPSYMSEQPKTAYTVENLGSNLESSSFEHLPSSRVFLQNFHPETTEAEVCNIFIERNAVESEDAIVKIKIMESPFKDRSFLFVDLQRRVDAGRLVEALDGTRIGRKGGAGGKLIQAKVCDSPELAERYRSLYISNIASEWTLDEVNSLMIQYGELRDVAHFPERGYGFVHFALNDLDGREIYHLKLQVEVAHVHNSIKRREPLLARREKQKQKATAGSSENQEKKPKSLTKDTSTAEKISPVIFVKNLDDKEIADTKALLRLFSGFGPIVHARLETYPSTNLSKGYGIVWFHNINDAKRAFSSLDKQVVGRKRIFVNWAEKKEDRKKRLNELFQLSNAEHCVENKTLINKTPKKKTVEFKPLTPESPLRYEEKQDESTSENETIDEIQADLSKISLEEGEVLRDLTTCKNAPARRLEKALSSLSVIQESS